jgi:hypothetical protein
MQQFPPRAQQIAREAKAALAQWDRKEYRPVHRILLRWYHILQRALKIEHIIGPNCATQLALQEPLTVADLAGNLLAGQVNIQVQSTVTDITEDLLKAHLDILVQLIVTLEHYRGITSCMLEICPECHRHGHIVLSDSSVSPEFCFKRQALEQVRSGLEKFAHISLEDAAVFRKIIRAMNMPHDWNEVDMAYLWQANRWSVRRRKNEVDDWENAHDFLAQFVPPSEIPSKFVTHLAENFPQQ